MQMTLELETPTERETATGVAGPVEQLVSQPWLCADKPWWWRQRQLQKAADECGQRLIIYRLGEYGKSLDRAAKARDEFYRQHEKAAIYAAG